MDQERENFTLRRYTISPFNIDMLNEVFIQIHSAESFDPAVKNFLSLHPEEISTDLAIFRIEESAGPALVTLIKQAAVLHLSCTCNSTAPNLCKHQSQVLFNLYRRSELRFFFDAEERQTILRRFATSYGLEGESSLEDYFTGEYRAGKLHISPRQKGLIPLNKESEPALLELVGDRRKQRHEVMIRSSETTETFVILKQHKYYKHLIISLAEAATGQSGKIKNPVTELKALDFIWKRNDLAETRFFTALTLFENPAQGDVSQQMIEALKEILKNPAKIPFYEHTQPGSDNISTASLSPVTLGAVIKDLKISVIREGSFYKITARLEIAGTSVPLQDTRIKLDYFLEYQSKLYLFGEHKLWKIYNFFRQNEYNLLIHQSRFEHFRNAFLLRLEETVAVNYAYLEPASPIQLKESAFDQQPVKMIYLTDSDPYIDIDPVMKYGNQEIAILSKRQIYSKGIKGETFSVKRDENAELDFISLIAKQHSFFLEQQSDGLSYFYLHKERFLNENWFLNTFEEWQRQGIQIFGFNKIRNNRLNQHKASVVVQVQSGLNWFNVDMDIRYGGRKASLKQVKKAVKNKSKYVELDDGTLGLLPADWVEKFRTYFETAEVTDDHFRIPKTNFAYISQAFDDEVLSNDVRAELDVLHRSFASFENITEVEPPDGLQGTLRSYQQEGLNWLNFLDDFNFGACLADDMGLGKTVQVLALLLLQRKKRRHNTNLLVVPTSLIFNWHNEIEKFSPSLKVYTLYGAGRTYHPKKLDQFEIVLTTYGTLLSDIRFLKDYTFNYVVLDESQNIKNPSSQRYKAVRLLKSRNRIALTGTPLENNTFDLYAQLSFACPGLLGSRQYFRDVYSTPIDKFKDSKRALELQSLIKPFILRRTKKQVAPELPEKTEMILYCEMQEDQRKIYEEYEKEMRDYLSGINNDDISRNTIHILRGLTRLRQICDSPLLLREPTLNTISSSKIEVLMEQIESKSAAHKILVFSQFVSMLDLVKKELEKKRIRFV